MERASTARSAEGSPTSVLLDVDNLTVRLSGARGTVHAVNGISYQLREGETLAVVGESGSGKSVHYLSMVKLIPTPPCSC